MASGQIVILLLGALAGGIVNGLTGFGTALTALGIWVYALPPAAAATLAILCSVVSQLQTLPMIWRTIAWKDVVIFAVPGMLGVPFGILLLPHIDPRSFKLVIGCFLVAYPAYTLARRQQIECAWGGSTADGIVGFGGGVMGGLTGLSGVLPVVWTDIRGWTKTHRRGVLQTFNMVILGFASISHVASGLVTRQVALAVAISLPATIAGALTGGAIYRRLADRGYERVVMLLLLASGLALLWNSW